MNQKVLLEELSEKTSKAVAHYWTTRSNQQKRQEQSGKSDQGSRSEVTAGAHMDGFVDLLVELIIGTGLSEEFVFTKKAKELPGFFRPTKGWDLLIVKDNMLIAAIEVKSQAGPSFGNNFNNRTEEAMGSALDLWTAFRERAFHVGPHPFLGYLLMLEDCEGSNNPVGVKEPHFKVFPEFLGASYARRYEIFCEKLVLERHYTASAFITSSADEGITGKYRTPSDKLSIERFSRALISHISTFV
jgi:hypothetical protein